MLMNTNHSLRSNDYHLRIWFSRYPKGKIPGRYGGWVSGLGTDFVFVFLSVFGFSQRKIAVFCTISATFWYCWIRSGQAGLSQIYDENLSECCQIWPVESKGRKTWVGVRILDLVRSKIIFDPVEILHQNLLAYINSILVRGG